MTDAKTTILARIREAQGDGMPEPDVPREYRTASPPGLDAVERFVERVADYRAVVHRAGTGDEAAAAAAIVRALAARGARRIVVPAGVPGGWLTAAREHGLELVGDDPPLDHAGLDAVDAVVTRCAVAIAETGTIVLDAGPGQGRRAVSLLPDVHVCVVRPDQIAGDVPEALARLDPRRPLTWISGPSATSDIELDRVEGVHGPRNLDVVILG